jgi:hypothetical protein
VKGSLIVSQASLGAARKDSFLLNVTTGLAHMPVVIPGMAAYVSTKLAIAKLFDYIAWENPDIHVVNLQPVLSKWTWITRRRYLITVSCYGTTSRVLLLTKPS